jgi:hypothetical protein
MLSSTGVEVDLMEQEDDSIDSQGRLRITVLLPSVPISMFASHSPVRVSLLRLLPLVEDSLLISGSIVVIGVLILVLVILIIIFK